MSWQFCREGSPQTMTYVDLAYAQIHRWKIPQMTLASLPILATWTLKKMDYRPASIHFYVCALPNVAATHSSSVVVTLQGLMERGMASRPPQTVRLNTESTSPVRVPHQLQPSSTEVIAPGKQIYFPNPHRL